MIDLVQGGVNAILAVDTTVPPNKARFCHHQLLLEQNITYDPASDYAVLRYSKCSPKNSEAIKEYSIAKKFPRAGTSLFMQCLGSQTFRNQGIHQVEFSFKRASTADDINISKNTGLLTLVRGHVQGGYSGASIVDSQGVLRGILAASATSRVGEVHTYTLIQ